MDTRLEHLKKLYELTGFLEDAVGGARRLRDCDGRQGWPMRGVYFFMEDGEHRVESGSGPRIVRVGTHALKDGSKTRLWTRLSQHRGQRTSGGGNHRGSIFRLIVGTALIKRHEYDFPTWDNRQGSGTAEAKVAEFALEQEVSAMIGAMRFVWLPINDEPGPQSDRGYIERNAIALLSNYQKPALDPASPGWLGHDCDRPRIRASGLWNANHVDEAYDPAFLDRLEQLIAKVRPA